MPDFFLFIFCISSIQPAKKSSLNNCSQDKVPAESEDRKETNTRKAFKPKSSFSKNFRTHRLVYFCIT